MADERRKAAQQEHLKRKELRAEAVVVSWLQSL